MIWSRPCFPAYALPSEALQGSCHMRGPQVGARIAAPADRRRQARSQTAQKAGGRCTGHRHSPLPWDQNLMAARKSTDLSIVRRRCRRLLRQTSGPRRFAARYTLHTGELQARHGHRAGLVVVLAGGLSAQKEHASRCRAVQGGRAVERSQRTAAALRRSAAAAISRISVATVVNSVIRCAATVRTVGQFCRSRWMSRPTSLCRSPGS